MDGTDSRDILTAFTRVFYEGRINIDSFRTIEVKLDDAGNPLPQPRVLLVFEVTVPPEVDRKALSRTLSDIAHDRHLSMSMQSTAEFLKRFIVCLSLNSKGINQMLTEREVISTLDMLRSEHLDVRTVTLGLNLFDCASDNFRNFRLSRPLQN